KRHKLVIFVSIIILFSLYIILHGSITSLNPSNDKLNNFYSFFDPIYSEYKSLRNKARVIDEIDLDQYTDKITNYEDYLSRIENNSDLENLKYDYRYQTELLAKRIRQEIDFFAEPDNYSFEFNKKKFEIYLNFLNELLIYQENYYEIFNIFALEKQNVKLKSEIELISKEVKELPEYSELDFGQIKYENLNLEQIDDYLNEQIKKYQKVVKRSELISVIKSKEITIQRNKIKIQEIQTDILSKITDLVEVGLEFSAEESQYYYFIFKIRSLLFVF
ncbi:MAG: hypothetical protein R6V36_08980, partial [Psychroflexus sp.]